VQVGIYKNNQTPDFISTVNAGGPPPGRADGCSAFDARVSDRNSLTGEFDQTRCRVLLDDLAKTRVDRDQGGVSAAANVR